MNITKIICPKCNAEAKLSLVDASYVGPRRCWKCHEYFTITIENSRVISCEPLSQEEFEKQQAAKKAAEKVRGGIELTGKDKRQGSFNFSERDKAQNGTELSEQKKTEDLEKPMETLWKNLKTSSHKEPSSQADLGKPASVYPPDKFQTFVPLKDTYGKPEKPPRTKKPDYTIPLSHKEPSDQKGLSNQKDPKGQVTIFPPERVRTFVPLEDTDEENKKT